MWSIPYQSALIRPKISSTRSGSFRLPPHNFAQLSKVYRLRRIAHGIGAFC